MAGSGHRTDNRQQDDQSSGAVDRGLETLTLSFSEGVFQGDDNDGHHISIP
jgi:hypothetical protein